jgi:hypothetical protein
MDQSTILFLFSKGLFQHVVSFCDSRLLRVQDSQVILWRAVAQTHLDFTADAINSLQNLSKVYDFTSISLLALSLALKKCRIVGTIT